MLQFQKLGLEIDFLEAIEKMGFETPTEIQELSIPHILSSEQDLIALAQTGTGKTGAFGLSCLQKINVEERVPQLLILAPTRELALQSAREIKKFSKQRKGLKCVAVYGGADIRSQSQALNKGCQIVVGTPGRTLDFIRRGVLQLGCISMVVLDEADEMLKMGFQEDLESILSKTPDEKQTLLFSATMPKPIEKIAKRYMNDPVTISVGKRNEGSKNVEHHYYMVNRNDRYLALKRLVDVNPDMYGLIFCRTKVETSDVVQQLRKDGYHVDLLNGDLSQKQRDQVMRQFRKKELQLLVATDVAARGLDVNNLSHVINFNLPDDLEVYIHRSGRTGRAGKSGHSLTLLTSYEVRRLKNLERMVGQSFTKQMIPSGDEISTAQIYRSISKMEQVSISDEVLQQYSEIITEKLSGYSSDEIVARLLSVMCGDTLRSYQNAPDLNERAHVRNNRDSHSRSRRGDVRGSNSRRGDGGIRRERVRKERVFDGDFTRCRINVGRRNGLNPNRLMGLVNEFYKGKKPDFGRIQIEQNQAFFDIEPKAASRVISGVQGQFFEGCCLEVSLDSKSN
jgi:ATP-dependent RNA helicase DeaD